MSFNTFTRPTAATAPTLGTASNMRPLAATAGAGALAGSFGAVHREVANFISQGGGAAAGATLPSQAASAMALALQARAAGETDASGAIIDGSVRAAGAETATTETQQKFLDNIKPWASAAARRLGVAPELVAARAALESGWGRNPVGNNLFGIKAGGQWQGAVAASATTEYADGLAMKKIERFRSYPDQAASFRDYADMLLDNPRYQAALNTGSDARAFAQGLARGGYATDPAYAAKLTATAARLQKLAQPGD